MEHSLPASTFHLSSIAPGNQSQLPPRARAVRQTPAWRQTQGLLPGKLLPRICHLKHSLPASTFHLKSTIPDRQSQLPLRARAVRQTPGLLPGTASQHISSEVNCPCQPKSTAPESQGRETNTGPAATCCRGPATRQAKMCWLAAGLSQSEIAKMSANGVVNRWRSEIAAR